MLHFLHSTSVLSFYVDVVLTLSFVLIWCSGTGERIWTHKGTDKLSWTRRGSNSWPPDWGNFASCQVSNTLASCHWKCVNKIPIICPRLHWTTDNQFGMHGCQFQHLCVLILNCALALAIYIFVDIILMLWHGETHMNPQRNR